MLLAEKNRHGELVGRVKPSPNVWLQAPRHLAVLFMAAIASTSCAQPDTIATSTFKSPDGNWIGSAFTKQWAGPGTAAIETNVFLKRAHVAEEPKQIMEFDNATVWPKGITNVEMKWLDSTHLEVGYRGNATISWQVVKFADLIIAVRSLASDSIGLQK